MPHETKQSKSTPKCGYVALGSCENRSTTVSPLPIKLSTLLLKKNHKTTGLVSYKSHQINPPLYGLIHHFVIFQISTHWVITFLQYFCRKLIKIIDLCAFLHLFFTSFDKRRHSFYFLQASQDLAELHGLPKITAYSSEISSPSSSSDMALLSHVSQIKLQTHAHHESGALCSSREKRKGELFIQIQTELYTKEHFKCITLTRYT